jgi:hypothetical protein
MRWRPVSHSRSCHDQRAVDGLAGAGAGTSPLTRPQLPHTAGYRLKLGLLGRPLTRDALRHQRLSKVLALGVLASGCISSSAYGTEEMLIVLLPALGIDCIVTVAVQAAAGTLALASAFPVLGGLEEEVTVDHH